MNAITSKASLLVIVAAIGLLVACPTTTSAKDDPSVVFEGFVSGIDVIAISGNPVVCTAFVSKGMPGGMEEVQVTVPDHRLQTVLESAASRRTQVEITYIDKDGVKILTRVRMLDRSRKGQANK
jgi:hypothetical protein